MLRGSRRKVVRDLGRRTRFEQGGRLRLQAVRVLCHPLVLAQTLRRRHAVQ
jgi:hypothetical protein